MTEAEFLFIHDNAAGNINTPDTINVNFDLDPNNSEQGIITGITVTVSDYDNEDLTTVLEQVEKVQLTLRFFGEDSGITELNQSDITLDIISRSRRLGFGFPYFYYKVNPTTVSPINAVGTEFKFIPLSNPNQIPNANSSLVVLTPVLSGVKYLNDDYNPLLSNASKNRSSRYLQVSDRDQLSLNPSNLEKLLSGSAEAAQVPDSNYTDTGLINARYEGSQTTPNEFGGIEPALVGSTFTGAIFDKNSTPAEIVAGTATAVYEELFHTGPENLPSFSTVTSSIQMTTGLGTAGNVFNYFFSSSLGSIGSVNAGNILQIEDISSGPPTVSERIKVISNNPENVAMKVERGYEGSTILDLAANDILFEVVPTRIFKFDEGGSRIVAVDNAKILVKENSLQLTTDKFGFVFTSSGSS